MTAAKVARVGMFVALAMIFSYIEALIPFNFGIPGMKLGLANLVTVTALYIMGSKVALVVSVIRIFLVSVTFGNMAALVYSLAGGLLSFLGMWALKKVKGFSVVGVSILGGVLHNVGQLCVAMAVVENIRLAYYFPVLLIGGMITGLLIGVASAQIIPRIHKADPA